MSVDVVVAWRVESAGVAALLERRDVEVRSPKTAFDGWWKDLHRG